jgi:hypothetical protein
MNGASKVYSVASETVQVLSLILGESVPTSRIGAPRDSAVANSMEDLLFCETNSCLSGQERKLEIQLPYSQDSYNMVKVKLPLCMP